jgi:hypothetical protein
MVQVGNTVACSDHATAALPHVYAGRTRNHGPSWAAGKRALGCLLNNQRFSNVQNLKFKNVTFPMSKIHQTSQGDSLKHKEQLSYCPNFKFPRDFNLLILEQIKI